MSENSPSTIYLPLENVESEHCALIVDRGLGQVNGVTEHRVELNNRRAAIKVENKEVVKEAIKKIKDMGYGVSTVKGTFPVLGMTCASCASSAQTIAQGTAGVIDASVNFATGNLTVEYLPNISQSGCP
jgi:Cu2+-exporting ATPase